MANSDEVSISRTTDAAHFLTCAGMMAVQDPWLALGMDLRQCLLAFEGSFREVYILSVGREIRGFAIIQPFGTFRGYIQTLCIHPGFQGRGYGKRLLQFSEEEIARYSPNVFICVTSTNKRAYDLYLRSGFELVGELKDFLKTGFTELLLRKSSGPLLK
jgi:ribosomal protein S18 acetylase RimI-like enzyme